MTGVYKITNTINGKIYIGQSINFDKRKVTHKNNFLRYIKNPEKHKSGCRLLYNAFNKHGFNNFVFELIELCTKDELTSREQYWIDFYKSYNRDIGYNLAKIAGSTFGVKHSDESKKKMSDHAKTRVGNKNPFYGKSHTDETKNKIKRTKTGSKMSPEFIEKWGKYKIWELNKKGILRYDIWGKIVDEWDSVSDASTSLNIKIGRISECLHGKQPTAGGYIWKFTTKNYPTEIEPNLSSISFMRNYNKYYKEKLEN